MKPPRFIAFAGDDYYPQGGWNDFLGGFDSIQDAVEELARMQSVDWWHVVDVSTGKIVKKSSD